MEGFPGWAATQIFGTISRWRFSESGISMPGFCLMQELCLRFRADSRKESHRPWQSLWPVNPTSALMAWAYSFSAAVDVLDADPRIDPRALA